MIYLDQYSHIDFDCYIISSWNYCYILNHLCCSYYFYNSCSIPTAYIIISSKTSCSFSTFVVVTSKFTMQLSNCYIGWLACEDFHSYHQICKKNHLYCICITKFFYLGNQSLDFSWMEALAFFEPNLEFDEKIYNYRHTCSCPIQNNCKVVFSIRIIMAFRDYLCHENIHN
jgi:hypothetical protein